MFRNASRISQHLRSLLLGASLAAGVTMAMGGIVGCADENDPETHVKYLQDPAKRTPAVNRLVQFFEDAMTKDKGDRNGPSVKPLLDKIVEPMSQTCVNDDLDEKTRSKVVKFLSDARDPRGGPCLIKTLKDYKPDSTEEDVRAAARGVGPMKLKDAAGPLFEAFTKIKNSKPKAQLITLDVTNALVDLSDPSWETQCVNMISKPINDRKDMNLFKDELYWQVTCERILGNLKSANAVKPLLKIMLSPIKADLQATAIYALIKIGKPAIDPALKLLKGEDTELVEYAKVEFLKSQTGEDGKVPDAAKKPAETAYLNPAALVLGSIGREEAAAPMIEALNKADDTGKVIIARELMKLPLNADVMKAVQTTYEKTPPGLTIPPGANGREALLERMSYTFDANLVPWLVKDALALKGDDGDLETVRAAAFQTSMKLMKPDQVVEVDKLYNVQIKGPDDKPAPLGKAYEKEYKATKDLLTACGEKVDCYMGKLSDPNMAVGDGQIVGIKAAYMVGVLGSPDVRAKLTETMPKIANDGIRFASVQVIDHFAPKGDADAAAKLQKIIDDAEATKDQKKIQSVNFFKEVVYRLNARL